MTNQDATTLTAGRRVVLGGVYAAEAGRPVRTGTVVATLGDGVELRLDGESRTDYWPAAAVVALPAE